MSSTTLIPMFDPEGTLRQVPQDQVRAAMASGGKVGVKMLDPAGKQRYIPHDQFQQALGAGGKVLPIEQQAVSHEGFWSALGSGLKDLITPSDSPLMGERSNMALGMDVGRKQEMGRTAAAQDVQRQQAGYGQAYRTTAGLAQSLGINAAPMEAAAAKGDTAGVLGHAAASATPYVAGTAISELTKPSTPPGVEAPAPKGSLVQRGVRSALGMGEEVMKKQARTSLMENAEQVGQVAQTNADAAAAHAKKVAQVEGLNTAGQEAVAKRAALQTKTLDDAATLAQQVQQKAQAVRTQGKSMYDAVNQAVETKLGPDAGAPAPDVAALVKHAEDHILMGSTPESIKQFRLMLEEAKQTGGPNAELLDQTAQGLGYQNATDAIQKVGPEQFSRYLPPELQNVEAPPAVIPYRHLGGYVTELGDLMYNRNVPNDVFSALKYVRDGMQSMRQEIATQAGAGEQLTQANQFWRRYEQVYNNSRNVTVASRGLGPERIGSPVARLVRMVDPPLVRKLVTGDVSERLISTLKEEDPALGALAEQIKRDHAASADLPKKYTLKPVPEAPEPRPAPDRPDLPAEISQARDKRLGQVIGKLRSPYALAAELTMAGYSRSLKPLMITVFRHGVASALERPGVVDYLTSITPRDMALLRDLDPSLKGPMQEAVTQAYMRKGAALPAEAKAFLLPAQVAAITSAAAARPENRYTTPAAIMLGMKSGDLSQSEGTKMLQRLRGQDASKIRRLRSNGTE